MTTPPTPPLGPRPSGPPTPPPNSGRPANYQPPAVGSTFGHYRIDRVIGVGGMGMVYSATDLRLGRQVALKVVLGQYADNVAFRNRFQREATVLARLNSPHVISIYDHGEHQGWPFLVTTYAGGGDLSRLLQKEGVLQPGLAAALCSQVADALQDAHQVGVVHRDVKPPNVLLRDERLDRLHIYLCDFGVAATESTGLTAPGSVAGTWNYLAPERAQGQPGTAASDIYSVGCLFWECLTGRPPFVGNDVEVAMAHLQHPVPQLTGDDDFTLRANYIFSRALAKDPADRYRSATELREHLRAISIGIATPTPTPTPGSRRAAGGSKRKSAALATAGALVVAGGVTAGVLLWPDGDKPKPSAAPMKVEPGVTGDIDDNGFGDVGMGSFNDGYYRLLSTGTKFKSLDRSRELGGKSTLGDIDGDGMEEIVTASFQNSQINIEVRFAGSARRPVASVLPGGPTPDSEVSLISGDFNGDGLTDLGTVIDGGIEGTDVSVSLSDGSGAFNSNESWLQIDGTSNFLYLTYAIGDVDNDGADDLLYAYQDESIGHLVVARSDGEGAFEPADSTPDEIEDMISNAFTAGDFDGDGDAEALSVDSDDVATIWEFNEDGTVAEGNPWLTYPDLGNADVFVVTDLNGDGADDLVVQGEIDYDNEKIPLLPFISTGSALEFDAGYQPTSPIPSDFDDWISRVVGSL